MTLDNLPIICSPNYKTCKDCPENVKQDCEIWQRCYLTAEKLQEAFRIYTGRTGEENREEESEI